MSSSVGQCFHAPIIERRRGYENGRKLPIDIDAARLTKKEKSRLQDAANGLSQKQIAEKECRSLPTITKQCASAVHKLNARSMTEAVAKALRQGIIASLIFGVLISSASDFVRPRGPQRVAARNITRRSETVYS